MVRFLCAAVFAATVLITVSSVAQAQDKPAVGPSPEESVARQEVDGLNAGQGPTPSLAISLSDYDFSQSPRVFQRILSSPHGYFRFISQPFAQAVCRRFADDMDFLGLVNLHGDAHLENYSITDRQRGLADFDDAAAGPLVLDLVRFGVSIHLASQALGIADQADAVVSSLIEGYRSGLRYGDLAVPEPAIVSHIRESFPRERRKMLAKAEALMQTVDMSGEEFQRALQQYAKQMEEENPQLPSGFFDVKRMGSLDIGIGSALDEKYLMRVEGPSKEPDDDVILEAKSIRDLEAADCVQRPRRGINRVAIAQARLSFEKPRYAGYVVLHPYLGFERREKFWVFAWDDNYAELSIPLSFRTPQDLFDVARDVGVQLGRGHPKSIADPYEGMLRRAILTSVSNFEADIKAAIRDLTRETITAWEWLREEAAKLASTQPSAPRYKSLDK